MKPAEPVAKVPSFFNGKAWMAHILGSTRGYLVCANCGETNTSERKLLAELCPDYSPVVSAFAWAL